MFAVSAEAYDRFMGRFSRPLAAGFADLAGVSAGQRVLDVGCGPGALIGELTARGAAVSAVDPSESFVAAARAAFPQVTVHRAAAEMLPFAAAEFDASLAQLVVHFMTDPVAGLAELARVTRPGGVVAACVWDGDRGPLAPFWRGVRDLDPGAVDESGLAGARPGHLAELFRAAGLTVQVDRLLTVEVPLRGFDAWWEPFTLGVGPAGAYVAGLDEPARAALRERCRQQWPAGPFTATAAAWAVRGRAG